MTMVVPFVFLKNADNVIVSAAARPRDRSRPLRIVRKSRLRSLPQQKFYHLRFSLPRGDGKWRRAVLIIAGVEISAMLDEQLRTFDVTTIRKMMQRSSANPVRITRIHPVGKKKLSHRAGT